VVTLLNSSNKLNISSKYKTLIIATSSLVAVFVLYKLIKISATNKGKLKFIADVDLRKWKGKKETDPSMSDELVRYWELVGKKFTETQMQNKSTHSSYPWSAVYISHLVKASGFNNFNPKTTHSGYVVDAKSNRSKNLKKSYWAYKPSEGNEVSIGDILIQNRAGSKNNLDTINSGSISHGDIVVDVFSLNGNRYASLQGGNVSDTVKRVNYKLTKEGKLSNNVHFAHLKYIK